MPRPLRQGQRQSMWLAVGSRILLVPGADAAMWLGSLKQAAASGPDCKGCKRDCQRPVHKCYRARVPNLQTLSALLLAVPLIGSSINHVFQLVEPPMDDGSLGAEMWAIIRAGGLMHWLSVGHALLGAMLLIPRTRFAAGILQLPITAGIVAFNVMMFPAGVALALAMLAVNLGVVLRPSDLRRLLAPPTATTTPR